MTNHTNETLPPFTTRSLVFSLLIFYALMAIISGSANLVGLRFGNGAQRLSYAPPGYVIGLVWFVLFTLMGLARYYVVQSEKPARQWWLICLGVLCASYIYYTAGLAKLTGIEENWFALAGCIGPGLYTALVCFKLYPVSRRAFWLVLPTLLWCGYATLIVLGQLRLKGLL